MWAQGRRARVKRGNSYSGSRCLAPITHRSDGGFTLIELVITITILTILTLSVMPMIKTSVKRQREQQLREALREVREAISEFRRDTVGIQCVGTATGGPNAPPTAGYIDPRQKVVISDCTLFGVDNPDHYPPTLETLVEGVSVIPRATIGAAQGGVIPGQATDNTLLSTKKKIYLRRIPVDPMTGKAEWRLRSCYDEPDASDWGGQNVFDVRSTSDATALNGEEKYSEW